jgi:hypothetical protein
MADVTVTLAHFWTDPQTGKSYGPEQKAPVDEGTAKQLRQAGIAQPEKKDQDKGESKAAASQPAPKASS